ncbi:class I SAM-dependent methyltransferase [Candidatus Amarobacter glycogenicus]|uniref:class I SAM-dependent methyltransferase n=1 Tax=Candidatus Amarobacter glycogenicus TaxID=3140699 RepID=UPI002A133338|nr:hypothetical protein [Dehalococcoidia bacterium]
MFESAGSVPAGIGRPFGGRSTTPRCVPRSRVAGYDTWSAVLELAEEFRNEAGLTNVAFYNPERTPLPETPEFDLVITSDMLHDLPRPDLMAASVRKLSDARWVGTRAQGPARTGAAGAGDECRVQRVRAGAGNQPPVQRLLRGAAVKLAVPLTGRYDGLATWLRGKNDRK